MDAGVKFNEVSRDTTFNSSRMDDVLAQNLVLSLDQIIKKDKRSKKTPEADYFKKLYYKFYFLKYGALIIYMAMVFFEVPSWCLQRDDIKDFTYCDYKIFPSSGIPKLPQLASRLIEIFCLLVLLFFTFFRRTFRLSSQIAIAREVIQSALTLIAIVDIIIAAVRHRAPFTSQFVRVILIVVFIRGLREAIKRIALVMYDSIEIVFMIIAYVVVFGWIGYRLFRGTQEGEAYFSTLVESIWSLLVLLTTANFPDVMLPAYRDHKAYSIFFIVYLILGLYFLLNLVLAIYYSNYKTRVENSISKFISIRENFLIKEFQKFDTGLKGYLTMQECAKMLNEIFLENMNTVKKANANRIAKDFSKKCDGKITPQVFFNYFDLMECVSMETTQVLKKHIMSARRVKCRSIVRHPIYDMIMNLLVSFNLLAIFAKDMLDVYGNSKASVFAWIYSEVVIAWFFLAEMIFLFYCFGPMNAIKRRNHIKFEIGFQIITNGAFIHFLITTQIEFMLRTLEIIIILRGLRLLKLFNEVKQWRVIMRTIGALLKPFYTLFLVVYILFLVFSIIGDRAFGGLLNMNAEEIFNDQAIPDNYVEMNFNDLANSFVTLFALMVVNNWFVIVSVFEAVTGTIWVRVFFVLFYFLSVIVVLNIVIAFAIDMYSSVETINAQKAEEKKSRPKSTYMSEDGTSDGEHVLYRQIDEETEDEREEELFRQPPSTQNYHKENIVHPSDLMDRTEEDKEQPSHTSGLFKTEGVSSEIIGQSLMDGHAPQKINETNYLYESRIHKDKSINSGSASVDSPRSDLEEDRDDQ